MNSPALLLFGRIGASALALISAPIVARAIGPAGRGETATAIAVFSLLPVLIGFGLPLELRRVVAVDGGTATVRTARRLVAISFLLALPFALLCWATLFQPLSEQTRLAASVGVALTPLTLSWICDTSVLVSLRDYRGILVLQLLQPVTYLIVVLALWSCQLATPGNVLWGYLLSNFMTYMFGILRVRASRSGHARSIRHVARGASHFAGGSLAEAATNRLDQVIALPVMGAVQTGLYSVAVTLGFAPLAIAQALASSYFARIAQNRGRHRKSLIEDAIRQVSALSFVSSLFLIVAGPFLVTLLFGEEFSDAESAIRVTAVACFFASISLQSANVLVAMGRGFTLAVSQVSALLFGVALLLPLGTALGALGAAIASACSMALMALLALYFAGVTVKCVLPTPSAFVRGIKTLLKAS